MKCQECDKTATFHITELTGPTLVELHLCVEHARDYLSPGKKSTGGALSTVSQQIDLPAIAEVVAEVEAKSCPHCGISFAEFRNHQRLGCPYDYEVFQDELTQLLRKIHGSDRHTGKRPSRPAVDRIAAQKLIKLRRRMREAVGGEEYEEASRLHRDIRALQQSLATIDAETPPNFMPDDE